MTSPAVGDLVTALQGAEFFGAWPQTLTYVPSTLSTPASGTTPTTWMTVGTVTVPTWASKMVYHLDIHAPFDTTTADNVTVALLVGSVAGVSQRMLPPADAANNRFHFAIADTLSGLSTGSQTVTIQATRVSGTGVFTVDGNCRVSLYYSFQP